MDFATLGVTTGGTATIDPITGAMTVTGGLLHLGGNARRRLAMPGRRSSRRWSISAFPSSRC